MSDTERRYVLEDELARLIGIRGAAEMLLPDVVNNMTLEDLDALIAEGRAAQATDVKEDTEAGTVGTTTSLALYKQFKAIPVEAFTDQAILAQAVIADAAWGMVPNPATYEPKPGLTRTAYQAQIADGQTRIGAEAKEVAVPLTRLLSSLTSYMILCRMASRL